MSYWAASPPQPCLPASPRLPEKSNFSKQSDFGSKTCRGRNPSPQSGASISRWGGSPFLIAALPMFDFWFFYIWFLTWPTRVYIWFFIFYFWFLIATLPKARVSSPYFGETPDQRLEFRVHISQTRGSLTCPRLPPLPLIPPWTGPPLKKLSIR